MNRPIAMAIGRFGAMFLAAVSAPLIARALGPDGRGLSAALLAVLALMPVLLGLGVPLAVRRRVSRRDETAIRVARRYLWFTLPPAILMALLLEGLVFDDLSGSEGTAYYVAMATTPLVISWDVDANILVARGSYLAIAIVSLLQSVVSTAIIIFLWLVGGLTVTSVIWATVLGNCAAFIAGRLAVPSPRAVASGLCAVMHEGMGLAGGQLADVSAKRIGQVVALPLVGAAGAGMYSIGVTMSSLMVPVVQAYGNAVFSELADGDRDRISSAMRQGAALALVGGVTIGASSCWLIPWVFGSAFAPAVAVTQVLLVAGIVSGMAFIATMALAACRRGKEMTVAQVGGLVVGTASLIPAGYSWGVVGCGAAAVLGAVTTLTLSVRALRLSVKSLAPRPRDFTASLEFVFGARL